jgi:heat shock protein 1/8
MREKIAYLKVTNSERLTTVLFLCSHCSYSLKQTLESPETGDKLSDADKGPVKEKLDEVLKFLEESSESASIEEIKERQTELEGLANPMMQKLYAQGGAPGGMPGGAPGAGAGDASGPEVEEGESTMSCF